MTATPQAAAAVRAIKHQSEWGPYDTRRYLERHGACYHFIEALRGRNNEIFEMATKSIRPKHAAEARAFDRDMD